MKIDVLMNEILAGVRSVCVIPKWMPWPEARKEFFVRNLEETRSVASLAGTARMGGGSGDGKYLARPGAISFCQELCSGDGQPDICLYFCQIPV